MTQPWLKFYPQDWRADEKLQMCSLAARGLWIEMLALMHRSRRYGTLLIDGKVPSDEQLAKLVGSPPEVLGEAIGELDEAGVFSRDRRDGAIFSRRMRRDRKRSKVARRNGALGGNPQLLDSVQNVSGLAPMCARPRESDLQNGEKPSNSSDNQLNPEDKPRTRTLPDARSQNQEDTPLTPPAGGQAAADLTFDLAGMAGITLTHRNTARSVAQVSSWLEAGITPDACRRVVAHCMAGEQRGVTRSLARFDAIIRTDHARGTGTIAYEKPQPPPVEEQIRMFETQAQRMHAIGNVEGEVEFLDKAEKLKLKVGGSR